MHSKQVYLRVSFDYEDVTYEPSDLVKLTFCLNETEIEELTQIVNSSRALQISRRLVEKLRDEVINLLKKYFKG